jgi:alpha-ribazole phosphatase
MQGYTLYLVRHAITEGNLRGEYIGSTDLPIADEGYARIAQYKESDYYPGVSRIYAADNQRCVQTAQIICPHLPVVTVRDLRECDFGEYEGKTPDALKHRSDYAEWLKGGYDAAPPGGESYGAFTLRCLNGLEYVFRDMADITKERATEAILVTHAGVIMNLLAGYGLPKGRPGDFALRQGECIAISLTTYLWSRGPAFEILGKLTMGE